ncbi:CinY protein [Kitasatospora sp. NPDC059747]|uniref:CinY protein n=1 Tax=Kitasatospora sp. NPDC059747 TaxID=3346930 RepID=UPI003657A0AC
MNSTSASRRRRLRGPGAACLALSCSVVLGAAAPAHAFSGENHEKITRAALGAAGWHPNSLTAMANGSSGAIVANDHGQYFDIGKLHCDNADYLDPRYDGGYPRTRGQADAEIIDCIDSSVHNFKRAVAAADRLVDANGHVVAAQTSISRACDWNDQPGRAKCEVLEDLGRGWHQIEDFYAHSNWADHAGPGAIGVKNPPGLGRTDLPAFFSISRYSSMSKADWIKDATGHIPHDLATGCYPDRDHTGTASNCAGRVTHDGVLNKDTKDTPRSVIDHNFDHAYDLAVKDIARQWKNFEDELQRKYPNNGRAKAMICAITHDHPDKTCS